ncbi:MAG TPA: hypothetical protein PLH94_12655 [Fimbriimonadaceae bacterium]|nr:hypothetical protein [Fimbriimonadaceae bacterium]
MIQMIGYLIGCLVGAGILTFLYAMTRPIRARGEMKSWKTIVGFFIVLVLAPYAWGEVLTRLYGKGMKEPIVAVLDDLKVNGGLRYYRVVSCWHDKARVIAVGTDQESWGGTENPVVAITMRKKDGNWSAESFAVVNSLKRNEDSMTFPPYW